MLQWNSCFFEIEENISGWCWRLRTRDHRCIATSLRDYKTRKEMDDDLALVLPALEQALKTTRLTSQSLREEVIETKMDESDKHPVLTKDDFKVFMDKEIDNAIKAVDDKYEGNKKTGE